MEERGFSVDSAQNGEDALESVSRVRPDIVITDMQMPKMSGGELIAALRSQPATANIPIVIVAGKQSVDAGQAGANFVIFKDIDIEAQLGLALHSILKLDAKTKTAALD